MDELRCRVVRWVSDQPNPGLVEAILLDIDGQQWSFIDKAPIFEATVALTASSAFPVPGLIRCTVIGVECARDEAVVVVDTGHPDGVVAGSGGETGFRVHAAAVIGD